MSTRLSGARVPAFLVLVAAMFAAALGTPAAFADDAAMPDLVGKSEADAGTTLADAGLSARVRLLASDRVDEVLEQAPAAGTPVNAESDIVLVIGAERLIQTVVPDVVGLAEQDVVDALDGTYFLEIAYVATGAGENGNVVGQEPAAGASLYAHDRLRLRILRRSVRVPSVLGQVAEDARAAIEQLGLRVEVSEVDDDAGAPGTVVAQDPGSNSEVVPGARVRLTVARPGGDVVPPALTAQVPNLVGKALGDAQAAAADAGFDLDIVFVDASGAPNRVIAQHVPAGTSVELGTVIAVDVSKAPPAPTTVTVPPVEGLSRFDAVAALQSSGLRARVSFVVLPASPVDRVARQFPPAGAQVAPNAEVLLRLPATSSMPNLMGRTKSQALASLAAVGLLGDADRVGPLQPGTTRVIQQDVAPGTRIARGTRVRFRYDIQAPPVAVPNVVGLSVQQAENVLDGVGLGALLLQIGGIGPLTEVVSTLPPAGTIVPKGSTVTVRYKRKGLAPILTTVPNLIGKSKAQASALLAAAQLGHQWQGPHLIAGARVASQSRPAGQQVAKGTVITVVFQLVVGPPGPGLQFRLVPDLHGKSKAQAAALLSAADLQHQWLGAHNLPGAKVASQQPAAGTLVAKNSVVKATFQGVVLPPINLTQVPNLIGKTKAQAAAALSAAHLNGAYSGPHNFPGARVTAQSRPAGQLVAKNTTINLTFAIGPIGPGGPGGPIVQLVQVPNVIGKTEFQARAALLAKGLQVSVVKVPSFPPPTRVKIQNPGPGATVAKGSTVTITIKK
ncbi:MAG: PASTA domain-containing protein [Planctomycetota bacterium]